MNVSLRVIQGPSSGSSVPLTSESSIELGADTNADMVLSTNNSATAATVLAVGLPGGCRIYTADGKPAIDVANRKVSDAVLRIGDQFQVEDFVIEVITTDDLETEQEPAADLETAEAFLQRMEIDLAEEELALLEQDLLPADYLAALEAAGHLTAALRILAHWLPKPESVKWSCQCVRQHFGDTISGFQADALAAAEQWTTTPDEKSRRDAELVADGFPQPDCFSFPCLAAFWSDGSMAPVDSPEVPPPDHLTGKAVCATLLDAAGKTIPPPFDETIRSFLDLAKPYPTS
ncbi:MAG: hypothetical protein CMJ70_15350 [Planctomycetaceae bacterium]|nr:hypothetical protein [Planctomycetaceae bacterium]